MAGITETLIDTQEAVVSIEWDKEQSRGAGRELWRWVGHFYSTCTTFYGKWTTKQQAQINARQWARRNMASWKGEKHEPKIQSA